MSALPPQSKMDHQARRQSALNTLRENKAFLNEWEKQNIAQHRAAMKTRRMNELKDVEFELTMKERREKRKDMKVKNALNDFQSSIQAFEAKLSTTNTTKPPQLKDPKIFLAKIKGKKETETIARQDRNQRRRKFLLDQNKMMEDLELQRRKDLKYAALMQESKLERELVKSLAETLKWKSVMKRNREYREKQYEQQKASDEAKRQEAMYLERQQREEERKKKQILLFQRFQEREEEKVQKRSKQLVDMCSNIVNDLIGITKNSVEFTTKTEGLSSSDIEKSEWKEKFLNGLTQDDNLEEDAEVSAALNEKQLLDYLHNKNQWSLGVNTQKVENGCLIDILSTIERTVNPPPKPLQFSDVKFKSRFPLRLSIIGKPLCGKSLFCQSLSKKFNLSIIKPEYLVQNCVESPDHPLCVSIMKELKQGQTISEVYVAQLIMEEINRIETMENIQGWVLDGYPNTLESAIELEKMLCDYQEINYSPKTTLLIENQSEYVHSRHPYPSFSKTIILDVSNGEIFRRHVGQYFDPETSINYHLTFAPPPDQSILSRLQPLDEIQIDRIQINEQILSCSKQLSKIQNFYSSKCSTEVVSIDAERDIESIEYDLECIANSLLEKVNIQTSEEIKEIETQISASPNEESDELVQLTQEENDAKNLLSFNTESAKLFSRIWFDVEEKYTSSLRDIFQALRMKRKILLYNIQLQKDEFISHLEESCVEKQSLVLSFQDEFNKVDQDIRYESAICNELHLRLKELRDSLWKYAEDRKTNSALKIEAIKKQDWIQEIRVAFTRYFLQFLQLEVNRYCHTTKFISDYFHELNGVASPIDPSVYEGQIIDVVNEDQGLKKAKVAVKKGKDDNSFDPQIPHDFIAAMTRAQAVTTNTINQVLDKKGKPVQSKKGKLPQAETLHGLDEAIEVEKKAFLQRIEILQQVYDYYIESCNEHWNHINSIFEKWVNERYHNEISAVRELCTYVENHIENGTPLEKELRITDDTFGVDDFVQVYVNPEGMDTDPSLQTIEGASFDFTHRQIMNLLYRFKHAASTGFITTEQFVTLFVDLISSSFGNADLPKKWMDQSQESISSIAESLAIPDGCGLINWKEFLINHCILDRYGPTPTQNEIMCSIRGYYDTLGGFMNVDSDYSNNLTMEDFANIKLWFHTRVPNNKTMSPQDINNCLYEILHETKTDSVPWHIQALIYTCFDVVPIKTIKNLFYIFSEGENTLDHTQLHQLFNINLPHSKEEFGIDQMRVVLEEYLHRNGNADSSQTISFDAFCLTAFGRTLIKQAVHLGRKVINI